MVDTLISTWSALEGRGRRIMKIPSSVTLHEGKRSAHCPFRNCVQNQWRTDPSPSTRQLWEWDKPIHQVQHCHIQSNSREHTNGKQKRPPEAEGSHFLTNRPEIRNALKPVTECSQDATSRNTVPNQQLMWQATLKPLYKKTCRQSMHIVQRRQRDDKFRPGPHYQDVPSDTSKYFKI